ncbi:MAG: hypothetical protein JWR24_294 [Actinoallomurus sp.]|nr:hypothetical protein [Actinoallomurus sp.]
MTAVGTPEFGEAGAVVLRALETVAVASTAPKVEEDFALESEFQAAVSAAAQYGDQLAHAVAAMLDRAAGSAHSDGERERLGRFAATERSHADLYRPILAGHERPCQPGWSDPWEELELGTAVGPLEDVAVFWGIVGPFLVLDASRFAGSAYGPLSRAATVVVQAWWQKTAAGMDRVAELSRYESGRAGAAAIVLSALPLVRSLSETASSDIAADWYRRGVTGLEIGADLRLLGTHIESAAAVLGLPGTPR